MAVDRAAYISYGFEYESCNANNLRIESFKKQKPQLTDDQLEQRANVSLVAMNVFKVCESLFNFLGALTMGKVIIDWLQGEEFDGIEFSRGLGVFLIGPGMLIVHLAATLIRHLNENEEAVPHEI